MAQLLTFGPSLQGAVEAGVLTLEQAWMLAWRTEVEPEQAWTQRESDALDLFHWHLMESERRPMAQ